MFYLSIIPQNEPTEPMTDRKYPSKKEGAYELEEAEEGVLGEEPTGKYTKEAALGEMVNESTVHRGV